MQKQRKFPGVRLQGHGGQIQSIHWDTEPSVFLQRVRVGFKKVCVGLGMLLHCTKPWAGFPSLSKLGLVVYTYSHGTREVEAGRSEASGQPGLRKKLVSQTKTKPKQKDCLNDSQESQAFCSRKLAMAPVS